MSPPITDERDKNFEALLKPLQDVVCKNWEIKLTDYLETYMLHLQKLGTGEMNFSEAALLLQNSLAFYSKRVDLVFNFMVKLTESLQRGIVEEENGKDGRVKKKKSSKVLQCEELEDLGFICADHNINVKLEKKEGRGSVEKKRAVLNTSVKVPSKANTSYLIYASPGIDMGYKDEYRLNWRTSSSGILSEDFNYLERRNLTRVRENFQDALNNESMLSLNNDDGEAVEGGLEEVVMAQEEGGEGMNLLGIEASIDPGVSPLASPHHQQCLGMENDQNRSNQLVEAGPQKVDFWAPLNPIYNERLVILPLKKKRNYTTPKSPLSLSQLKKRSANGDEKMSVIFESESYLCHTSILYDKNGPLSPIESKIKLEMEKRNQIILRRKMGKNNVRRAERPFDEDFRGFSQILDLEGGDLETEDDEENRSLLDGVGGGGSENGEEDEGISPGLPGLDLDNIVVPVGLREEKEDSPPGDAYERDAFVTMQKYKESKRENACFSNEIAKRVAAWHESIQPVLIEAEKRSEFNIQEYGTYILNKFPVVEEHPIVSFKDITRGQPRKEICRYFLSTLVLTNTHNVEVIKTDKNDLAKDCLTFKLLSRTRHYDEIDENMAKASGATAPSYDEDNCGSATASEEEEEEPI